MALSLTGAFVAFTSSQTCWAESLAFRLVNDSAQGPIAKAQALETLKKARDFQKEELAKVDKELKSKVTETLSYRVNAANQSQERGIESSWFNYSESLSVLTSKRQEALLKQKLIDQIMFEIDTKWNGQGMRSFLEHSFLDMSFAELTDSDTEVNRAVFLSYMSVAIREIPEKTDDLISFLIGYINFSSVSKPKAPIAYNNSRSYANGTKSMTASAARADSISQLVEKRMRILEEMRASSAKQPAEKNFNKLNPDRFHSDQEEDFDDSKILRPKESDKSRPSAAIINFEPKMLSEVLIKN